MLTEEILTECGMAFVEAHPAAIGYDIRGPLRAALTRFAELNNAEGDGSAALIGRTMANIDLKRLATDQAYWFELGAPEWATHCRPENGTGRPAAWFEALRPAPERWRIYRAVDGRADGLTPLDLEDCPDAIERPVAPPAGSGGG